MPRDSQRQRVYDAESTQAHGKVFTTVDECQTFVDRVLRRKRLRTKFEGKNPHRMNIQVHDGRGRRKACATTIWGQQIIELPLWARTELTILHEMAHHLSPACSKHDWRFCQNLLILVREMMGLEAESNLKKAYKAHRVRFRPPRTRQMTPEQAEAARTRLAAARASREAHRGRWTLVSAMGDAEPYYLMGLNQKFGVAVTWFTPNPGSAHVWTYRTTAEKWRERLLLQGQKVEVMDLETL